MPVLIEEAAQRPGPFLILAIQQIVDESDSDAHRETARAALPRLVECLQDDDSAFYTAELFAALATAEDTALISAAVTSLKNA